MIPESHPLYGREELVTDIAYAMQEAGYDNRVSNALAEERIYFIGQLYLHTKTELLKLRSFGKGSFETLNAVLGGLNLPPLDEFEVQNVITGVSQEILKGRGASKADVLKQLCKDFGIDESILERSKLDSNNAIIAHAVARGTVPPLVISWISAQLPEGMRTVIDPRFVAKTLSSDEFAEMVTNHVKNRVEEALGMNSGP